MCGQQAQKRKKNMVHGIRKMRTGKLQRTDVGNVVSAATPRRGAILNSAVGLAKAAANKLNERIDRVIFDVIDWDDNLREQYEQLVKKSSRNAINVAISKAVKRIYGFKSAGRTRAALIKTHTKFTK